MEADDLGRFAESFTEVASPAENRATSPVTGVTRAHWLAYADDLLLAAARYRSADGSLINLPGRPALQGVHSDGLEGFARTFLLAAFRTAGDAESDPYGHLPRYLEGILAGTQERGGSWPSIGGLGHGGQAMVESASLALGLRLTRGQTWDRLDEAQQEDIVRWLEPAMWHEPAPNNWYLFPMTVASFLESVGRNSSTTRAVVDRALGLLERWYRGDGWYSDGDGRAFDHYVGWALHFYPMLHATLGGDASLTSVLGERLRTFLETFRYTFDRSGAPLYHGRSLTYRVAAVASIGLGAVTGFTPIEPGESRKMLSKTLRYFAEHDSRQDGVLTLGWHRAHPATTQAYSGPGSPYWASKGFVALLAPADSALWTAREPEDDSDLDRDRDRTRPVRPAGLLIQSTVSDGLVRVHNHGTDGMPDAQGDAGFSDPLYSRFGYSTRTGPTAVGNARDNDVRIRFEGVWSSRRRIHPAGIGDDWAASWHVPRFPYSAELTEHTTVTGFHELPAARIQSLTIARGRIEVRVTRLVGIPSGLGIRLSGWALATDDPREMDGRADKASAGVHRRSSEPLASQLQGIVGWQWATLTTAPAGTAFGAWARMPELRATTSERLYVALASLTSDVDPAWPEARAEVTCSGDTIVVAWAEGDSTVVNLDDLSWDAN